MQQLLAVSARRLDIPKLFLQVKRPGHTPRPTCPACPLTRSGARSPFGYRPTLGAHHQRVGGCVVATPSDLRLKTTALLLQAKLRLPCPISHDSFSPFPSQTSFVSSFCTASLPLSTQDSPQFRLIFFTPLPRHTSHARVSPPLRRYPLRHSPVRYEIPAPPIRTRSHCPGTGSTAF